MSEDNPIAAYEAALNRAATEHFKDSPGVTGVTVTPLDTTGHIVTVSGDGLKLPPKVELDVEGQKVTIDVRAATPHQDRLNAAATGASVQPGIRH